MNFPVVISILILVAILFSMGIFYLAFRTIRKKFKSFSPILEEIKGQDYKILSHEQVLTFFNQDLQFLKTQGEKLSTSNITSAYFIHGTFVGNDPFNIVDYLESTFPQLTKNFLDKIRLGIRKAAHILARDVGNFSAKYEETFNNITHNKIETHEFTWSSANNHLARVKATISLIENIYLKYIL